MQYKNLYSIIYMILGSAKHRKEFLTAGKTEDSSMDITFLLYLQQFRQLTSGILDNLFLYITTLGEDWILFLGTAGIYWCVDKRTGFFMYFNYNLANYMNQFVKLTACINRPWVRDSRVQPVGGAIPGATGYSFPSGHTAKAMAVWGGLGLKSQKWSRQISLFLIGIVLLTGFSRNYLGVHTPQDVMVSMVIGIGLLIVSDKAIKWISQKKKREYVAIITGIVLSGILIGFASLKTYPMEYVNGQLLVDPESMIHGAYKGAGGVLGLCLGWLLEMKLVNFETKKYAVEERLLRFLYGAVGLIIILKVCPAIWPRLFTGRGASVMNGFMPSFYIIGGFPLLASWVSGRKLRSRQKL